MLCYPSTSAVLRPAQAKLRLALSLVYQYKMNALDFFHCNACFSQPGSKTSRFFLTNCGHSFCNECVNNTNVPQCRVCNARCKVIPLTNDLPEDLKLYFGDMVKEIKHLLKVLVIQNKHCKIYMEEYAKKLETSYAENQRELSKVKADLAELKKHYQELVGENQVLKKNASNIQVTQARNKSPFGSASFNRATGRSFNQHGSAFLTPSPSSISGESLATPRSSIPPVNSQPFVLSSQPRQANYSGRSSRGDSTPRSWSSGSTSRNTTKTIRTRDSFISKLNNSSIF